MADAAGAALDGLVVLDLTQQLPGPYATALLATMGAEVIKVEPPSGDPAREIDPAMFANVNAGKRSVVVDLKTDEGGAALRGLVARSDVFVEGFRPGVAARLGAGYEDVAGIRPDIVYCSLSGFGAEGPYRSVPGHDLNYLGVAGGADLNATGHIGIPMVDLASGTLASLAVVAALHRRARTGEGAYLDVAMLDAAVHWTHVKPAPAHDDAGEPAYGTFECEDGLRLTVAVLEDKFWRNLCVVLGWNDWLADDRLASQHGRRPRAAEIRERLGETLARAPRQAWLDRLWAEDVPVAPAHDAAEANRDPQVRARGLFAGGPEGESRPVAPIPASLRRDSQLPAPALGADTAVLFRERTGAGPRSAGAA
jgi:crotonobetainyl-CoA:carnitine CoA-transferase CaiB-like acyl-CoA transferase